MTRRTLPASFVPPLVRSLRACEKVETRRPFVVPQRHLARGPDLSRLWYSAGSGQYPGGNPSFTGDQPPAALMRCADNTCQHIPGPLGAQGDHLYVRERTRVIDYPDHGLVTVRYEDDGTEAIVPSPDRIKFVPPGHCLPNGAYREACRTWLEVTAVRVERLQAIDEAGAKREGCLDGGCVNCGHSSHPNPCGCVSPKPDYRDAFAALWISFYTDRHGPKSWHADPWVWVYGLKLITTDEAAEAATST